MIKHAGNHIYDLLSRRWWSTKAAVDFGSHRPNNPTLGSNNMTTTSTSIQSAAAGGKMTIEWTWWVGVPFVAVKLGSVRRTGEREEVVAGPAPRWKVLRIQPARQTSCRAPRWFPCTSPSLRAVRLPICRLPSAIWIRFSQPRSRGSQHPSAWQ